MKEMPVLWIQRKKERQRLEVKIILSSLDLMRKDVTLEIHILFNHGKGVANKNQCRCSIFAGP